MHEHFRAFEMTEKSMAQTVAGMGAFNQPGNVGDHERPVARQANHPEVRDQRGERVVRDFWPRRRDARNHRRLAGVWKSDEADVGEELQVKPQIFFFAWQPWLRLSWRAIGRCRERGVAVAAETTLRDQDALAGGGEVRDEHRLALVGAL